MRWPYQHKVLWRSFQFGFLPQYIRHCRLVLDPYSFDHGYADLYHMYGYKATIRSTYPSLQLKMEYNIYIVSI